MMKGSGGNAMDDLLDAYGKTYKGAPRQQGQYFPRQLKYGQKLVR